MSEENNVTPIESARKASPLTSEQQHELQKAFWTDVLNQIVDTPRFLTFMEANYLIEKGVDEETKTIHVRITEKPPVMPTLSAEQLFALHQTLMSSGVKDAVSVVKRILQIINHTEPLVQLASEGDLKQTLEQKNLKDKLDP